jgi:tetratricopeptide (TPR) repeat protein
MRCVLIVGAFQLSIVSMLAAGAGSDDVPASAKLDQLRKAVESRSDDSTAWLALAQELDRLGQENKAVESYQKAGALPAAREALGRYTRLDDATVAAAHYLAAAAMYDGASDGPAADRCRGEAVRLIGDKSALRQILERNLPSPDIVPLLPELVGKCGRPPEFVAELKRWAEQFPDQAGPVAAIAECERDETRLLRWLDRHRDPIAYAALARLWTEKPDRLVALVRGPARPERTKAIFAGLQSEPAAVIALLKNYPAPPRGTQWGAECGRVVRLSLAADCLDIADTTLRSWLTANPQNSMEVHQALLFVYEQAGQFARAEQLCRRCLQDYGDQASYIFHDYRARALMHLDQEKESLAEAGEVVKRAGGPDMVRAMLLQVEVLSWFGQHDVAHSVSRKLLEEFADAEESERRIRLRLAVFAENRRDDIAAEGHLLRVLELAPHDAGAQNNLGYYWADQNRRLADAERLCRFAVDRGRPSPDAEDSAGDEAAYRDSLGWVYYRQGRWIAAQEQIERALALPGGKLDAVLWEHYGDVLAARGQLDRARVAWMRATARIEAKRSYRDDPRPAELRRKLAINTDAGDKTKKGPE